MRAMIFAGILLAAAAGPALACPDRDKTPDGYPGSRFSDEFQRCMTPAELVARDEYERAIRAAVKKAEQAKRVEQAAQARKPAPSPAVVPRPALLPPALPPPEVQTLGPGSCMDGPKTVGPQGQVSQSRGCVGF